MEAMDGDFRKIPPVDRLLSDERIVTAGREYPREFITGIIRERLDIERQRIATGKSASSVDDIVQAIVAAIEAISYPGPSRVINASGIIIHTNLGRAPLSEEARAAMDTAGKGFSNLEFDVETGRRSSRHVHVEDLLRYLTGAEAAVVVNNNAAGIMLGLAALACRDRKSVV